MLNHPVVLPGWSFFYVYAIAVLYLKKQKAMRQLSIVFLAAVIFSCNSTNTAFIEKVKDADSVAINYFKGDGSMDSVVAVKIIRDKQQMEQLTGFIAAAGAGELKCGYDGSLHYFKKGMVLQDVDFRMNDVQCMHFSFMLNGKLCATALPAEARQLLESVKKQGAGNAAGQ
jgi:hypothetical protein